MIGLMKVFIPYLFVVSPSSAPLASSTTMPSKTSSPTSVPASVPANQDFVPLSKAEQWVVERINAGKEANLFEYSNGQERVLRGNFIRDIVRGMPKTNIKPPFEHITIQNAIIDGPVYLDGADILYLIEMPDCIFKDKFSARGTVFHKMVSLDGSTLKEAIFDDAIFRSTVYMRNTKYEGPASLNYIKCESTLWLSDSNYNDYISIVGSHIEGSLICNKGTFSGKTLSVSLNGTTIDGALNITQSRFEGKIDFTGAVVNKQFKVDDCNFMAPDKDIIFTLMKITGPVYLSNTLFMGTLYLNEIEASKLEVSDIKCTNAENTTGFTSINIHGNAIIVNSKFNGAISFDNSIIEGKLTIKDSNFGSGRGNTSFKAISVGNDIAFNNNDFKDNLVLTGMTYNGLEVDEYRNNCDKIFELFKKSKYDKEIYSGLEMYMKGHGYNKEANNVYIESRRRERKTFEYSICKFGDWVFLDLIFGYWRRMLDGVCIISIIIIIFGACVFRKRKMRSRVMDGEPIKYCPWWYSIDLFLPAISLQMKDDWLPNEKYKCVWIYMMVHALLGWICIAWGLTVALGIIW